ncbi:uncharacterized protein [Diadema setosum]|uniref:uncharacterized protein n=1 Tax=Diadema setosum TaxID=31175 RepID=UPI003B3ACED7
MGMSGSKSAANGDRPEGEDEFHTPVTNRRVQKLIDPRSPTDDINRTPLQREVDFEDPRSPTTKIARTPIPDDSDPRSPSAGREVGPFVFPNASEDPRSPSRIIARTPLTKDAPKNVSVEEVQVHQPEGGDSTENASNNNDSQECPAGDHSPSQEADSEVFKVETDSVKLVADDEDNEIEKCASEAEGQEGLNQANTPEYEMELSDMVKKQTIANEEDGDRDHATLVLSDREMVFLTELPPSPVSSKAKKSGFRRSLKEKFQSSSSSHQRSPLATRNLIQDSPDPSERTTAARKREGTTSRKVGVAFQRPGAGHLSKADRPRSHPVQVVGRYQPVLDKENC